MRRSFFELFYLILFNVYSLMSVSRPKKPLSRVPFFGLPDYTQFHVVLSYITLVFTFHWLLFGPAE